MNLRFQDVELPLARFCLRVDALLYSPAMAVFGPSGAGKTSLLDLVAGLRRPLSGRLELEGRVLMDMEQGIWVPARKRRIGYVPQDGALFPHLSVQGNLRYGVQDKSVKPFSGAFAQIVGILELESLLPRKISGLSGGEKQRVALARALLAEPKLLLLDEPLTGLDQALKTRILQYLRRVRDEFHVPFLYVTHTAEDARTLCEEVLVLEEGHVRALGPTQDLFRLASRSVYELNL